MERFKKYVEFARRELGLDPIEVCIEPGSLASPSCMPSFAFVQVGERYLRGRSDFQVAFGAFHEAGHIYSATKFSNGQQSSHDEELAADHVAGWLMGRAGFLPYRTSLDITDAWRSPFQPGGIFEHPYADMPMTPLMLHLGLDPTSSHPAGHTRVYTVALDGWMRALGGEAPLF